MKFGHWGLVFVQQNEVFIQSIKGTPGSVPPVHSPVSVEDSVLEIAGVVCPSAGVLIVVDDPPPAVRDPVQSLPAVQAFTQLFLE